jgi:ribosomal protein L37AE/L43A
MNCPECGAEMIEEIEDGVWVCPDCEHVEDHR